MSFSCHADAYTHPSKLVKWSCIHFRPHCANLEIKWTTFCDHFLQDDREPNELNWFLNTKNTLDDEKNNMDKQNTKEETNKQQEHLRTIIQNNT